jgi:hypothetical protein
MELSAIELSVLTRLFRASRGLYIWTLQAQYNLTAEKFLDLLNALKSMDYVRIIETRIQITGLGIEYMVAHPKKNEKKTPADILLPENFQGKKIGINEFYIPTKFEK